MLLLLLLTSLSVYLIQEDETEIKTLQCGEYLSFGSTVSFEMGKKCENIFVFNLRMHYIRISC